MLDESYEPEWAQIERLKARVETLKRHIERLNDQLDDMHEAAARPLVACLRSTHDLTHVESPRFDQNIIELRPGAPYVAISKESLIQATHADNKAAILGKAVEALLRGYLPTLFQHLR